MEWASFNNYTEHVIQFIKEAPVVLTAVVLALGAFVEYVFPPFPGDVIVLVGGFFAARGAIPIWIAFVSLVIGSTVGASFGWLMGRVAMENESSRRFLFRLVKKENIERLEKIYGRYGNLALLLNRFIPGIRATFMIGSGIAGFGLLRVAFWATLSAILWNSLLILLGFIFSHNFDAMFNFFYTYTYVLYAMIITSLLILLVYWIFRYLKRKKMISEP